MFKLTPAMIACIVCITCAQAASESSDREAGTGRLANGFKGRALQQSFGSAINTKFTSARVDSGVATAAAIDPRGSDCFIATSRTANLDCGKQGTGTDAQQVPACCSSSAATSTTSCTNWDNAGYIGCTRSDTPFPSCCTIRAQPPSVCNVASSTTATINCKPNSTRAIAACCNSRTSGTCTIDPRFIYGQAFNCGSTQLDACCPA